MNMMTIGGIALAILAIINITTSMMNFLGVKIEFYGSYLILVVAILIFYGVLPHDPTNYFT